MRMLPYITINDVYEKMIKPDTCALMCQVHLLPVINLQTVSTGYVYFCLCQEFSNIYTDFFKVNCVQFLYNRILFYQ